MDQFSYVIGLLSIVTGLALSDVGLSLHRLLRRRRDVRWDWLVLATAAYFGFAVVRYWYQVWSIRDFPGVTSLFFFLGILIESFVLFLMAAACLPDGDDLGPGVVDLKRFQHENSRYIWTLFLIFSAMWAAHGVYFTWVFRGFMNFRVLLVFLAPVFLGAALVWARDRRVQTALFSTLVLEEAWWMLRAGF